MIQRAMSLKVFIFPISLVVAVAVAILFIKPAYSDMNAAKKKLQSDQTSLESLKIKNQKLQKLKTEFEALSSESDLVFSALPKENKGEIYISELTSKASRSGVLLSSVVLGDQQSGSSKGYKISYECGSDSNGTENQAAEISAAPATGTPKTGAASPAGTMNPMGDMSSPVGIANVCVKRIGISLDVKGTWEQMLDFLKYLEDMNRISNVNSVEISSSSSEGQDISDILTASIDLSVFFKEESSIGQGVADSLASQGALNQSSLEKLKEVVYAQYAAPEVLSAGERDIFK